MPDSENHGNGRNKKSDVVKIDIYMLEWKLKQTDLQCALYNV